MQLALLLRRSPLPEAQSALILMSYASRLAPKKAALSASISRNTARCYYRLIRSRLVQVGYYTETPGSVDDPGIAAEAALALKLRRGVRPEDIPLHTAEIIEWRDAFPPRLVLKHLRKVIELTGPLDAPRTLDVAEYDRMRAYVRYARTELIHDRVAISQNKDSFQSEYLVRAKVSLENQWRVYRAASKRVERQRRHIMPSPPNLRRNNQKWYHNK